MKALTLWQPWAILPGKGLKGVETRSWGTSYRGLIAIHAGAKLTGAARKAVANGPWWKLLRDVNDFRGYDDLPHSAIVSVAQLHDVRRMTEKDVRDVDDRERAAGEWTVGRFGWYLDFIIALTTPVPAKGARGLWELDHETEMRVRAQTPGNVVWHNTAAEAKPDLYDRIAP